MIRNVHPKWMNTIGECFPQLLDAFLPPTSSKNVAAEAVQSFQGRISKAIGTSGDEDVMVAIATYARNTYKEVDDLVEDVQKEQETSRR